VQVFVDDVRALRFDDGAPVTVVSGIAPLGDGFLIAQDDATVADWSRGRSVVRVPLFPPVDGHDRFSEAAGTKHLKPHLEVACPAGTDGTPAVLRGSGSGPRRMRGVLVRLDGEQPSVDVADLAVLYGRVAERLGVPLDQLNLEGASRHGGTVRWFNRGNSQRACRRPAWRCRWRRWSPPSWAAPMPPTFRWGAPRSTTSARSTAWTWR